MQSTRVETNQIKIASTTVKSRFSLAPMAGITDMVLRQIVRSFSPGCLLVTEMLSSEAMLMNKQEQDILKFDTCEYPLSFQLSGHKPQVMAEAAKKIEPNATFIDINMGCPAPKIVKNGDGSFLMTDLKLASEIISSVKKAVRVPVTVKCRLGWDIPSKNYLEFAQMVQDSGADAITVHGRTRTQMYSGLADWQAIGEVKSMLKIPVYGNGDVDSVEKAIECMNTSNCDGIAIGRGALGDPELIARIEHYLATGEILSEPSIARRIELLRLHLYKEIEFRGEEFGIRYMRKFFAWYIKNIRGAAQYRFQLVRLDDLSEIERTLDEIISNAG